MHAQSHGSVQQNYVLASIEKMELFLVKQKFIYTVYLRILLTEKKENALFVRMKDHFLDDFVI